MVELKQPSSWLSWCPHDNFLHFIFSNSLKQNLFWLYITSLQIISTLSKQEFLVSLYFVFDLNAPTATDWATDAAVKLFVRTLTRLTTVSLFCTDTAEDRKWCHTFDGEVFDGAAFPAAAVWRQTEAADAPSCPDPRAQNVVWIQIVSALKHSREQVEPSVEPSRLTEPCDPNKDTRTKTIGLFMRQNEF